MIAPSTTTGVCALEAGGHVACDAEKKLALVGGGYGLAAFDISDIHQPRKLAFCKTGVASLKGGCHVQIQGDLAFLVGGYGLAVIDIRNLHRDSTPSTMTKIGGCETGVCTVHGDEACQIQGDLLFVAGGHGFAVLDVSTPSAPSKVTQIATGVGSNAGGAHCVLHRDYVYFGGGYGLAVINVSDPTKPVKVGESIETGAATWAGDEGMAVSGDRRTLFISGGGGLAIFDLADPSRPVRLSHVVTGVATREGGAHMAVVSPSLVLVAGGLGLAAVDVTDLRSPQVVKTTTTGVATVKGGAHVTIYGEHNQYAIVAGGLGMAILSTQYEEWVPGGGCCTIL